MESIYLDHNATTPTRPEVVEAMARCYAEVLCQSGQPASARPAGPAGAGRRPGADRRDSRRRFGPAAPRPADLHQRRHRGQQSGHSRHRREQPPLARRAARRRGLQPGQIIISAGEHQSVIEPAEHLLEHGWRLDTLGLTPRRRRPRRPVAAAARSPSRPALVSVQLGNHETGVLQPVAELAAICNRGRRAAAHRRRAGRRQAAGQLPRAWAWPP